MKHVIVAKKMYKESFMENIEALIIIAKSFNMKAIELFSGWMKSTRLEIVISERPFVSWLNLRMAPCFKETMRDFLILPITTLKI